MAFPFLGLFIIFLSVAAYYRKRATAQQKKVTEDFWSREDQANQIRRKDISNLPYITIPLEKFPIGISDDEELTDYENDLKTLASRKILNLSHQSNTDLKLAYGPANLPALSEYDQNYTTLLRNLVAYADCLIKNGFKAEAVPVLEFGISIDSDIRANYTLLAELYKEQGNASKIQELIDKAASLDSMMRSAILEQLHTLQNHRNESRKAHSAGSFFIFPYCAIS